MGRVCVLRSGAGGIHSAGGVSVFRFCGHVALAYHLTPYQEVIVPIQQDRVPSLLVVAFVLILLLALGLAIAIYSSGQTADTTSEPASSREAQEDAGLITWKTWRRSAGRSPGIWHLPPAQPVGCASGTPRLSGCQLYCHNLLCSGRTGYDRRRLAPTHSIIKVT